MSTAKDIMTKDVITIKKDTSIRDVIGIILNKRISGLPVVADDMSLEGIISEKDLLQLVFTDSIDEVTVESIMTRDVVTFREDSELFDICDYFMNENIKRVPILSGNKLAGILSRKDMLRYILEK